MTLVSIALLIAGCGGDSDADSGSDEGGGALVLKAGTPPSESDCAFDDAGSVGGAGGDGSIRAPDPGTYRYSTSGTETVPGGEGAKPLPRETETLVTPAREKEGLTCFGSERTLSERTRIPEVYVLRGEDVYITALGFDTPNLVESFNPRPAVLALSGSQSSWTGGFKGTTSGSYRVEIIGRRTLTIGGTKVKAVGLESTATYQGEATGTRRTVTWLAIDRSLVLQEEGTSTIEVGGGSERLEYRTRLLSMKPEAG